MGQRYSASFTELLIAPEQKTQRKPTIKWATCLVSDLWQMTTQYLLFSEFESLCVTCKHFDRLQRLISPCLFSLQLRGNLLVTAKNSSSSSSEIASNNYPIVLNFSLPLEPIDANDAGIALAVRSFGYNKSFHRDQHHKHNRDTSDDELLQTPNLTAKKTTLPTLVSIRAFTQSVSKCIHVPPINTLLQNHTVSVTLGALCMRDYNGELCSAVCDESSKQRLVRMFWKETSLCSSSLDWGPFSVSCLISGPNDGFLDITYSFFASASCSAAAVSAGSKLAGPFKLHAPLFHPLLIKSWPSDSSTPLLSCSSSFFSSSTTHVVAICGSYLAIYHKNVLVLCQFCVVCPPAFSLADHPSLQLMHIRTCTSLVGVYCSLVRLGADGQELALVEEGVGGFYVTRCALSHLLNHTYSGLPQRRHFALSVSSPPRTALYLATLCVKDRKQLWICYAEQAEGDLGWLHIDVSCTPPLILSNTFTDLPDDIFGEDHPESFMVRCAMKLGFSL